MGGTLIRPLAVDLPRDTETIEDMHVRPLGDDAAIIAYKVKESMVVDGENVELEAFDSSVWTRRDGKWVCALHTESLAGDPFGRS